MTPHELVVALRRGEVIDFDNRDALAIGDLFHGYLLANGSLGLVFDAFVERLPGPGGASGFIKAYLLRADAASLVFDELSALLDGPFKELPPQVTSLTGAGFPVAAIEVIRQGRPALLFFEPTPHCLAMTWAGFVLGVAAVDPTLGERQRLEALAFDRWARRYYKTPDIHWCKALRIFGGPGTDGLTAFVSLWMEFQAELPAEGVS